MILAQKMADRKTANQSHSKVNSYIAFEGGRVSDENGVKSKVSLSDILLKHIDDILSGESGAPSDCYRWGWRKWRLWTFIDCSEKIIF